MASATAHIGRGLRLPLLLRRRVTYASWQATARSAPLASTARLHGSVALGARPQASGHPAFQAAGGVALLSAGFAAATCSGAGPYPIACDGAPAEGSTALPELVESLPAGVSLQTSRVRLYQFESCPFCRKVRSCLDYHRVPYEIVEVHPLNKAETKPIAPDYKKVPILAVDAADGRRLQLRDSKCIVRAIMGASNPGVTWSVPLPTATPATGIMWPQDASGSVEEQWVRWTDVVLVQCIVLNVYRTMEESAETFKYLLTHPNFSWFAAKSGAWSGTVVMWGVAKSRKWKYKVNDERAALYEALDAFSTAVRSGGGPFIGGARPGVVDFNVFGILRSTESCQTERDFLEHCPSILPWWNKMIETVGPSCATNKGDVRRGPG